MTAHTQVSPNGDVPIPADVRARLSWEPGTRLEVIETAEGVQLKRRPGKSPFPPATLADLQALTPLGPRQPIEAISRLSDEDILRLIS